MPVREYKTRWERAKRDRDRLLKIRDIYFTQISPILRNIRPIEESGSDQDK